MQKQLAEFVPGGRGTRVQAYRELIHFYGFRGFPQPLIEARLRQPRRSPVRPAHNHEPALFHGAVEIARGRECNREVMADFGRTRRDLQRAFQRSDGLSRLPLLFEDDAERIPGIGVIGPQCHGLLERANRRFHVAIRVLERAEVVPRVREVGPEPQRHLELPDGCFPFGARGVCHAALEIRERGIRRLHQ
jgi:hypothetical protein